MDVTADTFRQIMGRFVTGVTVVTTWDPEAQGGPTSQPAGITVNALSSVSLDPPLVLVCVALTSQSYPAFHTHGKFAINVLHAEHEQLARRFASSGSSADKFAGTGYRKGALGLPILEDTLAELECTIVHVYPAGDHTIFVGRVEAADSRGDGDLEPLLYYRGRFNRLYAPGGDR